MSGRAMTCAAGLLLLTHWAAMPAVAQPSSARASGAPQQAESPATLPTVPLPPELDRVLRDYEKAWGARDPQALAALFAEDGFVLPGGRPPVRGRVAIEQHYKGSGGPLVLRALAFATDGSLGWIIGGYTGTAGGQDDGKFTQTLRKRADGFWLINSDMDNSNRRRPQ